MAVPVQRLRPRGAATASEPARAGFKRIRKVATNIGRKLLTKDYIPLNSYVNTDRRLSFAAKLLLCQTFDINILLIYY